jgi:hypothetical protein
MSPPLPPLRNCNDENKILSLKRKEDLTRYLKGKVLFLLLDGLKYCTIPMMGKHGEEIACNICSLFILSVDFTSDFKGPSQQIINVWD